MSMFRLGSRHSPNRQVPSSGYFTQLDEHTDLVSLSNMHVMYKTRYVTAVSGF